MLDNDDINLNELKEIFGEVFILEGKPVYKLTECLNLELKNLDVDIKISLILPGMYHTGFNQVMFENKYSSMNIDSYFKSQIEILRNRESFIHNFIEKKKLDSIVRKILVAMYLFQD